MPGAEMTISFCGFGNRGRAKHGLLRFERPLAEMKPVVRVSLRLVIPLAVLQALFALAPVVGYVLGDGAEPDLKDVPTLLTWRDPVKHYQTQMKRG